ALGLGFVTVLFGALTANLGAASACLGFPLCNGQVVPAGNYLQHIHWVHRLLAYTLFGYVWWWALRSKKRGAWYAVALVTVQVAVAAAMVLLALPPLLQAPTWRWARPCGEGWSWQYFEPSGRPPVRPSDQDQLVLWMGGVHLGALRVDVHVDLAAHAEAVRQIDARLDRETPARSERARGFHPDVGGARP